LDIDRRKLTGRVHGHVEPVADLRRNEPVLVLVVDELPQAVQARDGVLGVAEDVLEAVELVGDHRHRVCVFEKGKEKRTLEFVYGHEIFPKKSNGSSYHEPNYYRSVVLLVI
jgi:hypothetical protein